MSPAKIIVSEVQSARVGAWQNENYRAKHITSRRAVQGSARALAAFTGRFWKIHRTVTTGSLQDRSRKSGAPLLHLATISGRGTYALASWPSKLLKVDIRAASAQCPSESLKGLSLPAHPSRRTTAKGTACIYAAVPREATRGVRVRVSAFPHTPVGGQQRRGRPAYMQRFPGKRREASASGFCPWSLRNVVFPLLRTPVYHFVYHD